MSVRYSISILTYTAVARARRCIESVLANSPAGEFELILTANGSSEALAYFNSIQYPEVKVVENAINEGFISPSINALSLAEGEFFVCLNDDAEVPSGWLEKLRRPFDEDSLIALTGPEGGCCALSTTNQGIPSHRVEYVEFACVMGRTDRLREFGLFDPELTFAYGEDVDLSLRFREAGYRIKLVPFRIAHARGETSKMVPEIRRYQAMNGAFIRRRWSHYLKVRKFDYVTVIKRADAIGDVLLTTPIIRALRKQNPNSPIWVETNCPEVLENNPHVERAAKAIYAPSDARIIDLNMAYENAPLTHIVSAYAAKACLTNYDCRTEIHPSESDTKQAEALLDDRGWIAVHAGPTTWPGKNWPMARWVEVINRLRANIVLVGARDSTELPHTLDLRGKTSIGVLAACLKRCFLLVSVDSFPLHCAQAVGTPVVGLFGVTSPQFILTDTSLSEAVCSDRSNPSSGLRHRIHGARFIDDRHACMATITVDSVMDAITRLQPILAAE